MRVKDVTDSATMNKRVKDIFFLSKRPQNVYLGIFKDMQQPTIRKCARVKSQMRSVHFLTKCFQTINNQHPPTNVQQSENALCAVFSSRRVCKTVQQDVFNVCNDQTCT